MRKLHQFPRTAARAGWVLQEALICLVLENLLTRVEGLDILTKTFSKEDMDALISKMPYAKAPRPDGVNGLFLKKQGPL
jgi:hypothetical protein